MVKHATNLFETPPFLEQKLGNKAFDSVPQSAGIYRFYDSKGELIYVGKAVNLRRRLFGYKRIRAGHSSRKVRSLVSLIHRLEWDELPSGQEALLAENRWIRAHKPKFNHANKSIETYYFIKVLYGDDAIHFHLSMNKAREITTLKANPLFPGDVGTRRPLEVYGCFKGHNPVRRSLGALLRLLWISVLNPASPQHLPQPLIRNLAPMNFTFPLQQPGEQLPGDIHTLIKKWLLGESTDLLNSLKEQCAPFRKCSTFNGRYTDELFEQLARFFERTLRPHYQIREKWLDGGRIIRQDQLDDFMVKLSDLSG